MIATKVFHYVFACIVVPTTLLLSSPITQVSAAPASSAQSYEMPPSTTNIKPIDPVYDSRVTHEHTILNGVNYHFVNGVPKGPQRGVALLLHGFPDFWYGWRYTIPMLLDQGIRVIVPDTLGYGGTDAPVVPTDVPIDRYSWKSLSDDMAELLRQQNVPQAVVLGHDWGAFLAQRMVYHHPDIVSHIATFTVPWAPPAKQYIPIELLVKKLPNFKYQILFADTKTEKSIQTRDEIRRFLTGMHRSSNKTHVVDFNLNDTDDVMKTIGDPPRSKMITEKDMNYYIDQFSIHGMHGPFNYYRTRQAAFQEEVNLTLQQVTIPALFVGARFDPALTLNMTLGQERFVPNLTYRVSETAHWAMVEEPDQVNGFIKEWLNGVVYGGKSKL